MKDPRYDPRIVAAAAISEALAHFARNGRWGTCSGCPRTTDGSPYPEFCRFTKRSDHNLELHSIVERFERALDIAKKDEPL